MVKKFTASAEQLKPDMRFNSKLLSKFVNCLMHDGKKSVATRVVYDALDIIQSAGCVYHGGRERQAGN